MKQLVWSPRAAADLEAIREHIAYDSELYARLMVSRLVAAPSRLIQFPEIGRVVPEFGQSDLRELIVRPYRLVYRLRGEFVEITTVFHAARMFSDLPQKHASGAQQAVNLMAAGFSQVARLRQVESC